MIHNKIIACGIACTLILFSCKEKKTEDLTNDVNKNGSVETSVTVQPLDSMNDVLVTKHTVWVKGTQFNNIEYRDTVPSLGMETRQSEGESNSGPVTVKKDYEIFITVK